MHNIKDFNLSLDELKERYSPEGDGMHPYYVKTRWMDEVQRRTVLVGYWEWVRIMLEIERDRLDKDNPYNAWMNSGEYE